MNLPTNYPSLPYNTTFLISAMNKHLKYEPSCIRDARKIDKQDEKGNDIYYQL